jgi:hypothetical protein
LAGSREKQSACSVCEGRKEAGTTEVYVISDGADRYFFNVDRAKKIVADGRPVIELAARTIQEMLKVNHYDVNHLKHVDPSKPGILLQRFGGLILLDGIHRAALCLGEHRKFYVHALAYRESLACLVRQDIASHDPRSIAEKLRKVLQRDPGAGSLEAEIECSPKVLKRVRQLLTPEENKRLVLHAIGIQTDVKKP